MSKASLEDLKKLQHTFLHPQEQIYYTNLKYPKRQLSYLLGRYCAKQAISAYTANHDLAATWIDNGVFQQPFISSSTGHGLQVSLSHTDTLGAALAFPEAHPMAIDLEMVCADKIDILKTQITSAEQKQLVSLPGSVETQLTMLWTMKEALSKALHCGFMMSFELLETETLIHESPLTLCYFKHFHQYQALSFNLSKAVCTLVYPRRTQINLDIASIQHLFGS